ncbi:MAG TPA: protein kinase [Planctomycetaceae bacterium]|nr:protein kinase [Planctomycetaceae bacterium]HQZ66981.1 protein kinase [Planctomycetaceae bacterium]
MAHDEVKLSFDQSIQANSGFWYRAIQQLGRGGNATTWLMIATNGPNSGVPFAVKVFRKLSAPARRASFQDEMKFLESCDHPAIMRVYDGGVFHEEHPFIVADYMPQTLQDVIRSRSTRLVERIAFVCQLISALKFIATLERPIIHRDIKPANIFLKGRSIVLGDFGLMKRLDELPEEDTENALKHSVGIGMPFRYRTPDLVDYARDKRNPDCRSDVYQLGLVAAELFTGLNPQKKVKYDDMLCDVECDQVRYIKGGKGGMINRFITDMLSEEREDRPSLDTLHDRWLGLFPEVAGNQNALEGSVF